MTTCFRILAILILIPFNISAQVLVSSNPFTAATPFLEPDGRNEVVKISDNEFVVLSKVKGGLTGESEYSLEKYDIALKNVFKVPFLLGTDEDLKDLYYNGKEVVIFTVKRDHDGGTSKFLAYGFNPATGAKNWDKSLMEFKVGSFQAAQSKGAVEETFENAVASGLNKHFIIPFQYQYNLSISPDGSKIMAYIFDYSSQTLIASVSVFDKELNKISQGTVPVDNNFINYGLFINNRGDVYILNANRLGRIVLVQYKMDTKENKLLDIQYSSTQRECLKLQFLNDDEVYIGSINVANGRMVGLMYCKFNFAQNLVEKINFHDVSEGLKQTADAARSSNKSFKSPENWEHFEMTHFYVNKYEKVFMAVEKREITNDPAYHYQTEAVLEPAKWQERMAKVNAEAVVMVSFNSSDELMWENYYLKSQMTDISNGLTSASFVMEVDDELIRMIYASSDAATGVFNTYNYVEWNSMNGNKVKELPLQNDEKLALVRNYCVCFDDKVVLVGRKGLLGKKYIMTSYKLSAGN